MSAPVIDAAHLARQREWSTHTFGPGSRLFGVLDHIRKELKEIEDAPTDVSEWVDVIILAFDGAWRAGWEPQQIIDAIQAKQAKNEARTWPDWREMSSDTAIEHVRSTSQDGGRVADKSETHRVSPGQPSAAMPEAESDWTHSLPPSSPLCPECVQGKPQNCAGQALDANNDLVPCATGDRS